MYKYTYICEVRPIFRFSEEDTGRAYSDLVLKYFVSEGIVCKHETFLCSSELSTKNFIKASF